MGKSIRRVVLTQWDDLCYRVKGLTGIKQRELQVGDYIGLKEANAYLQDPNTEVIIKSRDNRRLN